MVNGENPQVVKFTRRYGIYGPKIGWGLLPADVDGENQPDADAAIVLVGSQDDDADFGATLDGVNIWELRVDFENPDDATFEHVTTLAAEPFDSIMECAPSSLNFWTSAVDGVYCVNHGRPRPSILLSYPHRRRCHRAAG